MVCLKELQRLSFWMNVIYKNNILLFIFAHLRIMYHVYN